VVSTIKLKFLLLLFLFGCVIPIPIMIPAPPPQFPTTERSALFVTPHGHVWQINIASRERVAKECEHSQRLGCVIIEPLKWGQMWTVDSFAVSLHECAHIFALDSGMTVAEIEAQERADGAPFSVNNLLKQYPNRRAMGKPCGPDALYSGIEGAGSLTGGRLMQLEECQHKFDSC
jgi:hypothetical protein